MSDIPGASRRVRQLFGALTEAAPVTTQHESMLVRTGLPNTLDAQDIAQRLQVNSAGAMSDDQREGVAAELVKRAREALVGIDGGGLDGQLSGSQRLGLEAVLQIRGRPSLRVLENDLEDLRLYPGAQIWDAIVDHYLQAILTTSRSIGALRVRDLLFSYSPWVQGTAWMVTPTLVMTNRHVLFPPAQGQALARRLPGTVAALLKPEFELTMDFAFYTGSSREECYRVVGVPFVAAPHDPIDVALLQVEHISGPLKAPLSISRQTAADLDHLYIVGHPGRLQNVPFEVNCVFGDPDERKRVSFGRRYASEEPDPDELVHDASTIGGFSGSPVLSYLGEEVRALHYWGDPEYGNRAISARALRRHIQLQATLESERGG